MTTQSLSLLDKCGLSSLTYRNDTQSLSPLDKCDLSHYINAHLLLTVSLYHTGMSNVINV